MTSRNDSNKQTFADFQRRSRQIRERRKEAERERRKQQALLAIRESTKEEGTT